MVMRPRRVPRYPILYGGSRRVSFTRRDGTPVSFVAKGKRSGRRRRRQKGGSLDINNILGLGRKVKGTLTSETADRVLDGVEKALKITRRGQKYLKSIPL